MASPGPKNSITDVPGIQVGCAEMPELVTGTTVILPEAQATCAVDHRGGGIGSRDTLLVAPGSAAPGIDALCLSGGSAYGLDAAGGVMHGLRRLGRGLAIGTEIVPLVPSAIIFDLMTGAPKAWDRPPWWELGLAALDAVTLDVPLGNAGAGMGATAGAIKGGQGTASYLDQGIAIGALTIANPAGSVLIPGTRTFWSWMLAEGDELGLQVPPSGRLLPDPVSATPPLANTTLAVIATDATLTRDEALRIAIMAQDGLARAIRPAHGPMDGDTVFVLSTRARAFDPTPAGLAWLGSLAADCTARAIARGVYAAESLAGVPAYRDLGRDLE